MPAGLLILLLAGNSVFSPVHAQARPAGKPAPFTAYLFVYFTGNSKAEEQIRYAISRDGYHFTALNNNQPVIASGQISETGGVRDPHILRGEDGKTFYMVATDMVSAKGWSSNRGMVLLQSTDLVRWSSAIVNIEKKYPEKQGLKRVWAPQTIYDAKTKKYMVYFSLQYGNEEDKIYYAYANKDFTGIEGEPKQLFYSPDGKACIDADIVYKDGRYHLFYKTEGADKGIHHAVSDQLTEGYHVVGGAVQQTSSPVEGAGVFRLNDGSGYILMYDMYMSGRYQFTFTRDLEHFKVVDQDVSMNFHPRHGTVISLTEQEAAALDARWLSVEDVLQSVASPLVRRHNVWFDTATRTLHLPLKPSASYKTFRPSFTAFPGVTVTQDRPFNAAGQAQYTVSIGQARHKIIAQAAQPGNPVLDGLYADPEVLYSRKHNRFYIYPTSDGFTGWSGTYFKVFASPDLRNWTDEGKILELGKDVQWAKRNAWAPCIVEKMVNGRYQYFYYFTAEGKIGVAVADEPTGPFHDFGKPLIDQRPEGVKGGQQIDPDVFTDSLTGKSYLYWGNGYMAGAELNDDMISLKPGTVKLLTPDRSFREGTYVFFRNGKYYFMWSENDTRDADYQVRYGTADAPLGKITVPKENLVLAKDTAQGIYGTGHNSVVFDPQYNKWYIVYHRFNYPNGIRLGGAAGFNREVCIDELQFNADGSIRRVQPTHGGVRRSIK